MSLLREKYTMLRRQVFSASLLLTIFALPAMAATGPRPAASAEEIQRLGEQMYRDGILPSGEAMKAFVSNDVPVEGTAFTCVSCHLRSGLGSVEGEVVTTPTNGRLLYKERKPFVPGSEFIPSISNYAKNLPERPAYSDATLTKLITTGVDPTGRSVLHVMPRYEIDDRDMTILIAYLKTLSDQPSPGVTPESIRFATVIVEGSDPVAVESMLAPIQFSIDRKNSLAAASSKNLRVARMGYNMLGDLHSKTFTLSRWTLKGAPETWRAQLDEYYRKEPVFALLGGFSNGEWQPVHRFCEDNRIPNLFPVVDNPVLSESDWYTLYLSRGIRQEGEAAARYLKTMASLLAGQPVVQVVRDSSKGQALAAGFRENWQTVSQTPLTEITLAKGEPLSAERLLKITALKPAVLIVWDDENSLPALAGLTEKADRPKMILTSATYLGKALWTVPEALREQLYLTYPYRLPQDDARFDSVLKKVLPGKNINAYDQTVLRQSYITADVLGKALMMMRGEYYRDFLYDTIGMMTDMYYPLYERVSFGPGQRYASKGCYIVQLGKGPNARLERRSEWVLP